MTDAAAAKPAPGAAKPKAESVNSATPEPGVPGVHAAAAPPCGCEDRVSALEGRTSALEVLNRSVGWLCIAIAAGVIYLLWNAPVKGKADGE